MYEYQPLSRQRMYLDKGAKPELYVESVTLAPHQYEGIRFLYKQFKKGKPGVILNDPAGYGKRVQTALFLEAVRPVLKHPVLVLCKEDTECVWVELFNQWTKMGCDVTIHTSNAELVRPVCLVSAVRPGSGSAALARVSWSMLVLEDGAVSREGLRPDISASYKIFITTLAMKANLQTFARVFKFISPTDRFIIDHYVKGKRTASAILARSILLDAFMENIVLRRQYDQPPLLKVTATKASRKNKDPTGTKTKRSKPQLAGEQEMQSDSQETYSEPQEEVRIRLVNKKLDKIKNRRGDLIVNIKPTVQTIMDVDAVDNYEQEKLDDMEIELNDPVMQCEAPDQSKPVNTQTTDSQNITLLYRSETPNINDQIEKDNVPTQTIISSRTMYKNNQVESEDLFSTGILSDDNKSENVVKTNEADAKSIKKADLPSNEVNNASVEIKTNDINNKNELVNKNNVSENKKTDPKLDGIELKMKQLEELAMKKFKGSLLDDIF